jgi:lysozyme family protein
VPNVEEVIRRILLREGGPTDLNDGAGHTYTGGQTTIWLTQYGLTAPKTWGDAATNVRTWIGLVGLTTLINKDFELGDDVADFAYNAGTRTAFKALQTILNVPIDGVFGVQTLTACLALPIPHWSFDIRFAVARMKWYASLGPSDQQFESGLQNRMAGIFEDIATAMETKS